MKVLFPFVGDSVGGSHISSLLLVEELLKVEGVTPIVVLHQSGPLKDFLSKKKIPHQVIGKECSVLTNSLIIQIKDMAVSAAKYYNFLKSNRVDLVHTNDRRMHLTWLFASKLSGAKFLWHQRTFCSSRRIFFYSKFASEILTISEACRASFGGSMATRAKIVPDPISSIDIEGGRTASRKKILDELNLPSDISLVAWVANWTEQKRPVEFLKMAGILRKKSKQRYAFLMFGEPRKPIKDKVYEEIERLCVNDCVYIMGARTPIEPFIAGCDVLTATAVREGLGRVLLEAMLLGTPVIATNDGGHLEIIENGNDGEIVPVDQPCAMANAVIKVTNGGKEIDLMVARARHKVIQKYSLEAHVAKVVSIYKSMI